MLLKLVTMSRAFLFPLLKSNSSICLRGICYFYFSKPAFVLFNIISECRYYALHMAWAGKNFACDSARLASHIHVHHHKLFLCVVHLHHIRIFRARNIIRDFYLILLWDLPTLSTLSGIFVIWHKIIITYLTPPSVSRRGSVFCVVVIYFLTSSYWPSTGSAFFGCASPCGCACVGSPCGCPSVGAP